MVTIKKITEQLGVSPLVVIGFDTWGKENIVVDPFIGEVLGLLN